MLPAEGFYCTNNIIQFKFLENVDIVKKCVRSSYEWGWAAQTYNKNSLDSLGTYEGRVDNGYLSVIKKCTNLSFTF